MSNCLHKGETVRVRQRMRCAWVDSSQMRCVRYHDLEWGVPVHEDHRHFEMLSLESAQAGLSWVTVLNKREGYRRLFKQFDPQRVAQMSDADLEVTLHDAAIIRNRKKVYSTRQNAHAFLKIQDCYGSFDRYIWSFVGHEPIINAWRNSTEVPASTSLSQQISQDLQRHGMAFVGATTVYAYMQAAGLVCDHTIDCFRHTELVQLLTKEEGDAL